MCAVCEMALWSEEQRMEQGKKKSMPKKKKNSPDPWKNKNTQSIAEARGAVLQHGETFAKITSEGRRRSRFRIQATESRAQWPLIMIHWASSLPSYQAIYEDASLCIWAERQADAPWNRLRSHANSRLDAPALTGPLRLFCIIIRVQRGRPGGCCCWFCCCCRCCCLKAYTLKIIHLLPTQKVSGK